MPALENNRQWHSLKLSLGGQQFGEILFFLEERSFPTQKEQQSWVRLQVPLVPVACSLTSPRYLTAKRRKGVSLMVIFSTEMAYYDCRECPPRDF